jgi:hypothetical protein
VSSASWVARWEPPAYEEDEAQVELAIPATHQSIAKTDISYPSSRPSLVAPLRLSAENLRVFNQMHTKQEQAGQATCDNVVIGAKLCDSGPVFYPFGEETLRSLKHKTAIAA